MPPKSPMLMAAYRYIRQSMNTYQTWRHESKESDWSSLFTAPALFRRRFVRNCFSQLSNPDVNEKIVCSSYAVLNRLTLNSLRYIAKDEIGGHTQWDDRQCWKQKKPSPALQTSNTIHFAASVRLKINCSSCAERWNWYIYENANECSWSECSSAEYSNPHDLFSSWIP